MTPPDDHRVLELAQLVEQRWTETGRVLEPPEPFESVQDALVHFLETSPAQRAKAEHFVRLRREPDAPLEEQGLAFRLSYELTCALFGRTPAPAGATISRVDVRGWREDVPNSVEVR